MKDIQHKHLLVTKNVGVVFYDEDRGGIYHLDPCGEKIPRCNVGESISVPTFEELDAWIDLETHVRAHFSNPKLSEILCRLDKARSVLEKGWYLIKEETGSKIFQYVKYFDGKGWHDRLDAGSLPRMDLDFSDTDLYTLTKVEVPE